MPYEVVQYPSTDGISGTELTAHWSRADATGEGVVQLALTNHIWGRIEPAPADAVAWSSPANDHSGHNDCSACAAHVAHVEALRAAGKLPEYPMVEVSGGSVVGEYDTPASVVTKKLARGEINKLIHTLRRARDQAYGADA